MHMHTCAQTDTQTHTLLCPFLSPGLIIDAFGELRDQQEQVKEDMEVRFDTFSRTHKYTLYAQTFEVVRYAVSNLDTNTIERYIPTTSVVI